MSSVGSRGRKGWIRDGCGSEMKERGEISITGSNTVRFTCVTLQDYPPNQITKEGENKDACRRFPATFKIAHTVRLFMHLFSVLALLLLSRHLEVIYGCGMDLEKNITAEMSV